MLSAKQSKGFNSSAISRAEAEAALKDQALCRLELQQTLHLAKIQGLEKLRAELESARDAFATLYEQSPVSYLTLDSKGKIHDINGALLALVGYARKRLLN